VGSADPKTSRRFPWFLPDGKHVFYLASPPGADYAIRIAALDSALPGAVDSFAEYAQGRLLFLRVDTLVARPFDLKTLAFTGDALPIVSQIQGDVIVLNAPKFSVAQTGVLVYRSGVGDRRLTWFDRSGKRLGAMGEPANIGSIAFSPDRGTVALAAVEPSGNNPDIWLYDMSRGVQTRFTFNPAADRYPTWSPDGRTIVFRSDRTGIGDFYRRPADGSRNEELLYSSKLVKSLGSFSPDGKFLAYEEQDPKTGQDLWILPDPPGTPGVSKPYPFIQTEFNETSPEFSPDGHWIAYSSNESGRSEVYVAPFPGPGGKRQLSASGGSNPRWRPDGKELFYIAPGGRLISAEVDAKGASFEVKKIEPLFGPVPGPWDVSADGQRFLMAAPPEGDHGQPITVVQNWVGALKK
jgi:dipeptidyl aminopeptidase/acylaminoacyl peptidase